MWSRSIGARCSTARRPLGAEDVDALARALGLVLTDGSFRVVRVALPVGWRARPRTHPGLELRQAVRVIQLRGKHRVIPRVTRSVRPSTPALFEHPENRRVAARPRLVQPLPRPQATIRGALAMADESARPARNCRPPFGVTVAPRTGNNDQVLAGRDVCGAHDEVVAIHGLHNRRQFGVQGDSSAARTWASITEPLADSQSSKRSPWRRPRSWTSVKPAHLTSESNWSASNSSTWKGWLVSASSQSGVRT